MTAKIIALITGANQGLGYYAAQQLANTGKYLVLIGSRDLKKAEIAIQSILDDSSLPVSPDTLSSIQIDVNDDSSIAAAAQQVSDKYGHLDILLNNAGVAQAQAAEPNGPSLREIYRSHYETNVFGAMVVTDAFLPLLRKSQIKRLAFTSSGLGSLELAHKGPGPYSAEHYPIYRSTKSALNMLMLSYARLLEKEGFVVSAADPGYCATNLNSYGGFKDPREGAKELIKSIVGEKEAVHAVVVTEDGIVPW